MTAKREDKIDVPFSDLSPFLFFPFPVKCHRSTQLPRIIPWSISHGYRSHEDDLQRPQRLAPGAVAAAA
jgi:hypothetical protein